MAKQTEVVPSSPTVEAELVPARSPSEMGLGLSSKRFWTSLNLETDEGRKNYLLAKQGQPKLIADYVNKAISVKDILIHDATSVSPETGEVQDWVRVVLFTPTGEMIACGSEGVRNSLADFVVAYGNPPWKDGLKCRVVQKKTGQKRNYLTLEPV